MKKRPAPPFNLRAPCANCPFRTHGAIELRPGRVENIAASLLKDDRLSFSCHKTIHNDRTGGHHADDGEYVASGKESECYGAMLYRVKAGRPSVAMRLAMYFGILNLKEMVEKSDEVIDVYPGKN